MPNQIQITGGLGRDPELRFTPSGTAALNGSIADTPRKFDKDRGEYVDAGDTLWLEWTIWGQEAEDLAERLSKGTRVTINGTLKQRTYTTKDGTERTVVEITATSIAVHPKKQGAGWASDDARVTARSMSKDPKPKTDDPWASNNTDPWGAQQ